MSTLPLSITDPGEVPTATEIATAAPSTAAPSTLQTTSPSSTPSSTPIPAPAKAPSLTPAQLAGITIAGVATAVIVFFLIGSLTSCHRKRNREQYRRSKDQRSNSRFGASDKELATDLERAQDSKDGQATFNSPSDIARAYPKFEDPSNIGVAVSSPSQAEKPHAAQNASSWSRLLPMSPPKLRISPPRECSYSGQNAATQGRQRQSFTPVSPPSAYTDIESPVALAELPGDPLGKHLPAPLKIQKPGKVATPLDLTKAKNNGYRESTQSISTIISEEPMSPPARSSIVKIHTMPVASLAPPAEPRPDAESRDYIPSYYMQPPTPSQIASGAPVTPSIPDFSQGHHMQAKASTQSESSAAFSPPVSKFAKSPLSAMSPTNIASPPSSWRAPPSASHDHQSKTPPPGKRTRSGSKSSQKPLPPPTRRSSQRNKKRDSNASVTSFETSEDESEAAPQKADQKRARQLSPLPESNAERSPKSSISYPRVPRAATQYSTRSSGSPTRAGRDEHSGSTLSKQASNSNLLEKRKGSDAASDLQKALWITGSNGSTKPSGQRFPVRASSQKGSAGPVRATTPETKMTSPLWEPKLTPKRNSKGGLVLEVS